MSLPADSRSDEILLQFVECEECGLQALAVYQESRRGALDDESWEHTGYRLGDDRLRFVAEAMGRCPNPMEAGCQCEVHRMLGRTDDLGRWQGLSEFGGYDPFPMVLSSPIF